MFRRSLTLTGTDGKTLHFNTVDQTGEGIGDAGDKWHVATVSVTSAGRPGSVGLGHPLNVRPSPKSSAGADNRPGSGRA